MSLDKYKRVSLRDKHRAQEEAQKEEKVEVKEVINKKKKK